MASHSLRARPLRAATSAVRRALRTERAGVRLGHRRRVVQHLRGEAPTPDSEFVARLRTRLLDQDR